MHVVVLGAGYAGVTLTERLEDRLPAEVSLSIVDERETHLVQHLVHRVIRDPDLAEELQIPIESIFDRATHRQATVEGVDTDGNSVELSTGDLEYDVGAVCLGARTNFRDLPGVESYGMPLKRVAHALAIRERFLELGAGDRVVVGGAGTSGVQVAGELAELAAETDRDVEILLLEERESVVPSFPADFRSAVAAELANRDVHIHSGVRVERAEDGTVHLADGGSLSCEQFVWTGGITGGEAMGGQRPRVDSTLRLADRTFALGDAASVVDDRGQSVPASAQTAMSQARIAARNVSRLVEHDLDYDDGGGGFEPRLARYTYDPRGWLVSVGDGAVAKVGPQVLRGRAGTAIKESVGIGYLGSVGGVRDVVGLVRDHLRYGTGR